MATVMPITAILTFSSLLKPAITMIPYVDLPLYSVHPIAKTATMMPIAVGKVFAEPLNDQSKIRYPTIAISAMRAAMALTAGESDRPAPGIGD
jgi:hypothetical protein